MAVARSRPRLRLPDPVPVVVVFVGLLVVWEVVSWTYFNASVAPEFRAGAGLALKLPPGVN